MNKEELHDKLKACQKTVTISEQDIINIYGKDESRKIGGVETCRADVLARTYNLIVTKDSSGYLFCKELI